MTASSCMTCAHFNASYKICSLEGEITYPIHTRCDKWADSAKNAEAQYIQVRDRS